MDADNYQMPLYWPSVGLATFIILAMAYFAGAPGADVEAAGVPSIVSHLANGMSGFRHLHYAPAGLVLAIGASLGAPTARHSLVWIGVGAAIIAVLPLMITLYQLAAGYGAGLQDSASNPAIPGTYDMTGLAIVTVTLGLLVSIPLFFFAMAIPTALAAAASSIIIHFGLDRLNGLPLPWQAEDEDSSGEWVYEIGGGVAIIAIATYLLFGTWVQSWDLFSPANKTPQEVYETLDPPPETGTLYSTEAGRNIMRHKADSMKTRLGWIAEKPCTTGNRRFLKDEINDYFGKIRIYEGWKPGKQLTPTSARIRDMVAEGLSKNYIDWGKLSNAVRIHLDGAKYQKVKFTMPANCGF